MLTLPEECAWLLCQKTGNARANILKNSPETTIPVRQVEKWPGLISCWKKTLRFILQCLPKNSQRDLASGTLSGDLLDSARYTVTPSLLYLTFLLANWFFSGITSKINYLQFTSVPMVCSRGSQLKCQVHLGKLFKSSLAK